MRQGFGRPTPATIVALLALVAALAGSAYAAGRIDGHTVKVKSLPGNRLKPGSVPANRLKPGAIQAAVTGPITGSQIDERSLGQVPSAGYADVAGFAQSAVGPAILAALPEPPVPLPKQSAFLLVGMLVVPVFSVFSASTLPLATTRRSASTFFAEAIAVVETNRSRASAHAAASRIGMSLGI